MKIEKIIEMIQKGELEEAKSELIFLNKMLEHLQEEFKDLAETRKKEYDKKKQIEDYASHLAYENSYEFLKETLKEI